MSFATHRFGRWVALLYFFSGAVGLGYQVLWARMLSLQFGVSIFGVVVTAAAFMLGLGLGALVGGRWAGRISSPLRTFAMLEAGVAFYALLLPHLLQVVDGGLAAMDGASLFVWYGLQALATLILVVVPTFALGLGFPLVLRALRDTPVSLGRIYGLNTCGAALGALLPLWLLPLFGWRFSIVVVAMVGLAVAGLALWLSSRFETQTEDAAPAVGRARVSPAVLLAYAGVGAAALALEIGWTRLFGMLLLRTEYVMAIILAVFLVGIGVGSLISRWLRGPLWLDLLPIAAGLFALGSLWGIPALAAWAEAAEFGSLAGAMVKQGLALALLTLPVTLILGIWLPLLSRHLGSDKESGAILYGANSVGAALGALTAGFVLIPLLGTALTIVVAALLLFGFGMYWAQRRYWLAAPLLLLAALPVTQLPGSDRLLPQAHADSNDLAVHEDALAITHVVQRADGQRLLLADLQRMDASSEPAAVVSQQNQVRLPLLLHPEPKTVLFLGLGTGISASASLPFPGLERTAVELSQGAIDAAQQWFAPVNGKVSERLTVVRDDARRYLRSAGADFDVIIGDLFHPDLVGRSALLSLQQFERAKARLNEGGVFVQWLAMNQFDSYSLSVVLRTFGRVFPDGVMFVDGFRLALVGTRAGSLSADKLLSNLSRLSEAQAARATGDEGGWSWLGRYWGPVALPDGPVQDEWAPVIEYQLPRARYQGGMDLAGLLQWLLSARPDMERAAAALAVAPEQGEAFERAFVATELALRAWQLELKGKVGEAQRLLRLAYGANPKDRWISGAVADRMLASVSMMGRQATAGGFDRRQALQRVLEVYPGHEGALEALWQLEEAEGDLEAAREYRRALRRISPLAAAAD